MYKGKVWIVALLVIAVESSAGCERFGGSVPVAGKVMLNNKPLPNATVMFAATKANGLGPFIGTTDAEGQFVLGQNERTGSGGAAGDYNVFISTVKSDPNDDSTQIRNKKEIVPTEYRNGSKTFKVPPSGTKEANFDMNSR